MRTAVLFSGGKDSCLATEYAMRHTDVVCFITLISKRDDSYMFHIPNAKWTTAHAKACGISIIIQETIGEKEKELVDLKTAIKKAIDTYRIEGIVTGAVGSVYQASRIQQICHELTIECFNPLWQKDQIALLQELVDKKYQVIIVGTFGEGLNEYLGFTINKQFIEEMRVRQALDGINPAGEGGELESFVLDAPFFKEKLNITKSHIHKESSGGKMFIIDELERVKK